MNEGSSGMGQLLWWCVRSVMQKRLQAAPRTGCGLEYEAKSAGFAVRRVRVATRAVLLHLKTVRVVAPVLLGDVVPLLALHAGQRDLRADVGGSHGSAFLGQRIRTQTRVADRE